MARQAGEFEAITSSSDADVHVQAREFEKQSGWRPNRAAFRRRERLQWPP